jgi:hypothetical protein
VYSLTEHDFEKNLAHLNMLGLLATGFLLVSSHYLDQLLFNDTSSPLFFNCFKAHSHMRASNMVDDILWIS